MWAGVGFNPVPFSLTWNFNKNATCQRRPYKVHSTTCCGKSVNPTTKNPSAESKILGSKPKPKTLNPRKKEKKDKSHKRASRI